MIARLSALLEDAVLLLDERDDVAEQILLHEAHPAEAARLRLGLDAQLGLQRPDLGLLAGRAGDLVAERHDDQCRLGFPVGEQVVHDPVGPAGLRPPALEVVGPVEQVEHGVLVRARAVAGRGVDDDAAGGAVVLVDVPVLVQSAVRHVAERHPLGPLAGHVHLALVHPRRGADVGVRRVGHGQPVHDVPVLVRAGLERLGGERPDPLVVLGHVLGLGREVALDLHGLRVRGLQAEDHAPLLGHLGRQDLAVLAAGAARRAEKDEGNCGKRDRPGQVSHGRLLAPVCRGRCRRGGRRALNPGTAAARTGTGSAASSATRGPSPGTRSRRS